MSKSIKRTQARPLVDWQRMRELSERVQHLQGTECWTEAAFYCINAEALEAGDAAFGTRDWLLHEAEAAWRERLLKPSPA